MARATYEITKEWLLENGVIDVTENSITYYDGRRHAYVVKEPRIFVASNPGKTQVKHYLIKQHFIGANRVYYAWTHGKAEAGKFIKSNIEREVGDAVTTRVNGRVRRNRRGYIIHDKLTDKYYNTWADVIRAGQTTFTNWREYVRESKDNRFEKLINYSN